MQKKSIQISYTQFDSLEKLPAADLSLLVLARKSLENAYAPYSHFKVGAAALLENGELLGGANYENASYSLCVCAERSLLAAVSSRYPGVPVIAMAITVKNLNQVIAQPVTPCGACRQVIVETEQKNQKNMRLILQGESGAVYVFAKGSDLLPLAFDNSFL